MQVLIAVIDDLFQFVCKAFSGAIPYVTTNEHTPDSFRKILKSIQKGKIVSGAVTSSEKNRNDSKYAADTFHIGEQYFIGVIGTYFYQDPVLAFDSALRRLEYGKSVRLISLQGRWAQIRIAGVVGWVFKDALCLHRDDVYPHFTTGIQYDATHTETTKLRACIDDEFGGARGEHILSAAEYVHYYLKQKKRVIHWGDIRMRIPGTWQRKLKGCLGIHIGITPKVESVMEYAMDDVGHLAFVEAVFPDGSIKISEIGKFGDCAYTEEVLQPEQWKELGPVFIDIQ